MSEHPYLKKCLAGLNSLNLNPLIKYKMFSIKAKLMLGVELSVIVLIALSIFGKLEGIHDYIEICTTCTAMSQASSKGVFILVYKKEFAEVIHYMKKFWPRDKYGAKVAKELNTTQAWVDKMMTYYKYTIAIATFLYFLKPVYLRRRLLPLSWADFCHMDTSISCYIFSYIIQIFIGFYTVTLMYAFDALFCMMLSYGYCEIEQVKHALANLDIREEIFGDDPKVLKETSMLVRQHNRALHFIEKHSSMYTTLLLWQFSVTLFGASMTLFVLMIDGLPPPIGMTLRYGPFLGAAISQICIYCIAGEAIAVQTESIAEAAYNSNWYLKTQPRLRKAIGLIILRGQRRLQITAGGVWDLNMVTLGAILRAIMSMLAFTQTMLLEMD